MSPNRFDVATMAAELFSRLDDVSPSGIITARHGPGLDEVESICRRWFLTLFPLVLNTRIGATREAWARPSGGTQTGFREVRVCIWLRSVRASSD